MKIVPKVRCCDEKSDCCKETKKIDVLFLYLDLKVCERCQGSDKNLDQALNIVQPVLKELGYELRIKKINVNTEALAKQYRFISSPTIRINNIDIQEDVQEDNCKSCGDLCGDSVDCRVFTYQNKQYHEPPVGMIIDQILKSIYTLQTIKEPVNYQVPENLLKFYRSKESN
jgi:hypothetical protein